MKYQYELACRQAGLSEEKIRAIRNALDDGRKTEKRKRRYRERQGIVLVPMNFHGGELDENEREIEDVSEDLEEDMIRRMDLELLQHCMDRYPEQDTEILLSFYRHQRGSILEVMEKYRVSRKYMERRRREMESELKQKIS